MPSSKWFRTDFLVGVAPEKVDSEAGIIRGAAIVTEGEAKGHGVFLDSEFVDAVVSQGNAAKSGMKIRFGHPSMSDSAIGSYMGRARNFRRDGQMARADLHLSDVSRKSPKGNLRDYAIEMASKENEAFGMSICFEHGEMYQVSDTGEKITKNLNEEKPIFVEMKKLLGADFVDDPAANPNGLFSSTGIELPLYAAQVSAFLESHPEVYEFARENPDIVSKFMAEYQPKKQKEAIMPEKKKVQEWAEAFGEAFAVKHYDTISYDEAVKKHADEKAEAEKLATAEKIKSLETENAALKAELSTKNAEHSSEMEKLSAKVKEQEAKLSALSSGAPPVTPQDTPKPKARLSDLFNKKQ